MRIVLVHSPLVGPLTWSLVAEQLREHDIVPLVPALYDADTTGVPFWRQHVDSVVQSVEHEPVDQPLILVGHSGAGPLLPAIGQASGRPIAGYVFVDAGLPHGGASRLDEMALNVPAFAAQFRQHLTSGGRFPDWNDADLREIIPDDRLRQRMVAELRPRTLPFFQEPMPQVASWTAVPCGYILFSAPYATPAAQAQQAGWCYREFDAGHFHMLVDPGAVADALIEIVRCMQEPCTLS